MRVGFLFDHVGHYSVINSRSLRYEGATYSIVNSVYPQCLSYPRFVGSYGHRNPTNLQASHHIRETAKTHHYWDSTDLSGCYDLLCSICLQLLPLDWDGIAKCGPATIMYKGWRSRSPIDSAKTRESLYEPANPVEIVLRIIESLTQ